jgi:hypothetical protein
LISWDARFEQLPLDKTKADTVDCVPGDFAMDGIEIRARAVDYQNHVELVIVHHSEHVTSVAEPLIFKEVQPATAWSPTTAISMTAAQTLMDDLWHSGLRPTEGSGSAGSLAATERHLADMQLIVYNKLNIKK